jgi:hypothetical protein
MGLFSASSNKSLELMQTTWLICHSKMIFLLALLLAAGLGMALLWSSTPYGLGLVNDSAYYVEGAANLLAGKGFVRFSGGGELKPITHFPPLFSLVLAFFGLVGMDLLAGARLLITLFFGIDILLVGLSVYTISRSIPFAIFGALILAFSDVFLNVFSLALSEPLFLTLLLVGFLVLAQGFAQPKWVWPLLAGFLLSLAYLARYAGISLFITALLAVALLQVSSQEARKGVSFFRRTPFRELLLLLAGACLPVLAWNIVSLSASQAGALSNRQVAWHPLSFTVLFEALKNLLTWAASDDLLMSLPIYGRLFSLLSLILLPVLLSWLAWVVWLRVKKPGQMRALAGRLGLSFTHALLIPVYLAFLVASLSFFDASTPLNARILSVLYLPEVILFASGLAWVWRVPASREPLVRGIPLFRWLLGIFCGLFLLFSFKDGLAAARQLSAQGQGFAHQGWRESPIIQAIREMPDIMLYSNKPTAIYLLTGRNAYIIPTPTDSVTGLSRDTYAADRELLQQRVKQGQALLVLFGLKDSQVPDEVTLFNDLSAGLPVLADFGNAVIFGIPP